MLAEDEMKRVQNIINSVRKS